MPNLRPLRSSLFRVTATVAARELSSSFRLPLGWIAIALFVLLAGATFVIDTLRPGEPASMRAYFSFAGWLLLPIVPAVSMRLIAEELRSGTIEPLMTSPASDFAIVLGKFVGTLVFLLLLIAPSLVHAFVLRAHSDPAPDVGPLITGYLALALTASLYLALGLLMSSFTSNQTLAFMLTFFAIMGLLIVPALIEPRLPQGPAWDWARAATGTLSIGRKAADFSRGVIDLSHLTLYLSATTGLLVLAAVSLESRRWR